jgi:parallel beta-helix repeat protein
MEGKMNTDLLKKWLAIGIILLFTGTCIIPAIAQDTENSQSTSRDNWLYVGGSGPGNYSKIQDAINDSTDGDTIFVYDDSSPYNEYLLINRSIRLLGENWNTTRIKGNTNVKQHIIQINADGVTIQGFTIRDSTGQMWAPYYGIAIYSNDNDISRNIFINNEGCILLSGASRNSIHDNRMIDGKETSFAIGIYNGRDNEVFNNYVSEVSWGIDLGNSAFNKIHGNRFTQIKNYGAIVSYSFSPNITVGNQIYENCFSGGKYGILVEYCSLNFFYCNEIANCQYGIYRITASFTFIMRNNFINNTCNAYFYDRGIMNTWSRNYWDDWDRFGIYKIQGETISFGDPEGDPWPIEQYDWRPAWRPYDISGMR